MKKLKLILFFFAFLWMSACKETTIVKEEYNPPAPRMLGTWKYTNINAAISESYLVFSDNGSNLAYILTKDTSGFATKETFTYKADDKLVYVFNGLYNYDVRNDSLFMQPNGNPIEKYVKVNAPNFTPSNWTNSISIMKRLQLPRGVNYNTIRPFGIDGDILYLCGTNTLGNYVYKYNTLTNTFMDSISIPNIASLFYKAPNLYYGFQSYSKIYKTSGLTLPSAMVSTNDINYTQALSLNPNSGVIYAMESSANLYAGTDGSNFNAIFNSSFYSISNVLFFQNDEFIGLKNNTIARFKINPKVSAIKTYDTPAGFYTYVLSSNGSDHWLFGWNSVISNYELVKINLN